MEPQRPADKDWSDMSAKERAALGELGWTEATWQEPEGDLSLTQARERALELLGLSVEEVAGYALDVNVKLRGQLETVVADAKQEVEAEVQSRLREQLEAVQAQAQAEAQAQAKARFQAEVQRVRADAKQELETEVQRRLDEMPATAPTPAPIQAVNPTSAHVEAYDVLLRKQHELKTLLSRTLSDRSTRETQAAEAVSRETEAKLRVAQEEADEGRFRIERCVADLCVAFALLCNP